MGEDLETNILGVISWGGAKFLWTCVGTFNVGGRMTEASHSVLRAGSIQRLAHQEQPTYSRKKSAVSCGCAWKYSGGERRRGTGTISGKGSAGKSGPVVLGRGSLKTTSRGGQSDQRTEPEGRQGTGKKIVAGGKGDSACREPVALRKSPAPAEIKWCTRKDLD